MNFSHRLNTDETQIQISVMRNFSPRLLVLALVMIATSAAVSAPLTLSMPLEMVRFKPGKGAEIAGTQCILCHSADYVIIQPPMPRAFWQASVQKMREKYGAPILDTQVAPLVEYLTATYGKEK